MFVLALKTEQAEDDSGKCNFKKSYWRDNGAPDNSNSTELKLKDETEVKFRDSIYESVRTEIQQYDRIQLSHWTGVTESDDTGVKGLETEFRRANAEQHIYINKTSVWKGQLKT